MNPYRKLYTSEVVLGTRQSHFDKNSCVQILKDSKPSEQHLSPSSKENPE